MDIPAAPILADITVNGRPVKAMAQTTKQAFLYVFNRETGEPIWPIVERPVPKAMKHVTARRFRVYFRVSGPSRPAHTL